MPFAYHCSLKAGLLKKFWECHLRAVKLKDIIPDTVYMAVLPCQNRGAAGSADTVRAKAVIEADPLGCDPV